MDIAAYKTYMLDKAKDIQQKIDNASLSQSAKQLLSLEKELNIIQTLTQAPWLLTQAALQQKNCKEMNPKPISKTRRKFTGRLYSHRDLETSEYPTSYSCTTLPVRNQRIGTPPK